MKHLLTGVAVVAALAISAPIWAQPASPSGGNAVGVPGPNPGGPGLTPYSTGTPPPVAAPTSAPPPEATAPTRAFGKATHGRHHMEAGGGMPISATPPATPSRHGHHKMAAHHPGMGSQLTGSTADQLNQEELARLQQAGNMPMSAAPPAPGMAPPPQPTGPAPPSRQVPGPKASGGY
jgi:hypothetical protein